MLHSFPAKDHPIARISALPDQTALWRHRIGPGTYPNIDGLEPDAQASVQLFFLYILALEKAPITLWRSRLRRNVSVTV